MKNEINIKLNSLTLCHSQMFYGMGHFSKYVPEDSVRIDIRINGDANLKGTAFLRPDGKRSVVLLNLYATFLYKQQIIIKIFNRKCTRLLCLPRSNDQQNISLEDTQFGTLELNCPARSIHTIVY